MPTEPQVLVPVRIRRFPPFPSFQRKEMAAGRQCNEFCNSISGEDPTLWKTTLRTLAGRDCNCNNCMPNGMHAFKLTRPRQGNKCDTRVKLVTSPGLPVPRKKGRFWRFVKRVMLGLVLLLVGAAVAGAAYQAIGNWRDARCFPARQS